MKRYSKKKLYEDDRSMLGLDFSIGNLPKSEYTKKGVQKINTQNIPRGRVPEINLNTLKNIEQNKLQALRNYYPSAPQFLNTPLKEPIDKWKVAQQLGTAGLSLYSNYRRIYGDVEDDDVKDDDGDDYDEVFRDVSDDGDDVLSIDEPWEESKHQPKVSVKHDILFYPTQRGRIRDQETSFFTFEETKQPKLQESTLTMPQIQADVTDGDLSYPFFVGLEGQMEAPEIQQMMD